MKRLLFFFLFAACGGVQTITNDGSVPDAGREAGPNACGSIALGTVKLASIQNANPLDPLGYPPYAADGCQLAYVAKDGTLMLRDLSRGTEVVAADATEKPRRPSIAGGTLAWEATLGGKDLVRWRNAAGNVDTINGAFARAGEPRAAADAVVFTAWTTADPNGDTDVLLFSTTDKSLTPIGDGAAQQRFADIDATRVAWADFSEGGPTGAFESDLMTDAGYSPADIVVWDRAAKTKTTRKADGKQAFPLLVNGGAVAYLDWATVRPQPKFFAYGFKVGPASSNPAGDVSIPATGTIETDVPYVRPTVRGSSFEWLENGQLWRRPTDLSTQAVSVESFANAWGVVASDSLSLVATGSWSDLTLQAVSR